MHHFTSAGHIRGAYHLQKATLIKLTRHFWNSLKSGQNTYPSNGKNKDEKDQKSRQNMILGTRDATATVIAYMTVEDT